VTETDTGELCASGGVPPTPSDLPFRQRPARCRKTLKELRGIYFAVFLSAKDPHKLMAARFGPPSVIGVWGTGIFSLSRRATIPGCSDAITPNTFSLLPPSADAATVRGCEPRTECGWDGSGGKKPPPPGGNPAGSTPQGTLPPRPPDPLMAQMASTSIPSTRTTRNCEHPRAVRDRCCGRISQESRQSFLSAMKWRYSKGVSGICNVRIVVSRARIWHRRGWP